MIKSFRILTLATLVSIPLTPVTPLSGMAPSAPTFSLSSRTKLIAALAGAGVASWYLLYKIYAPLQWDWTLVEAQGKFNPASLTFSQGFLWGVGSSAQQVEGGCTNNSWSTWEKEQDTQGKPHVEEVAGNACNQWDEKQLDHDIKLLKELGVNAYRFSIEWSKIEPQEGVINQEAISHYVNLCKKLRDNGIRPVITLHHYTDPLWFMAHGGFEKAENTKYYVTFCVTMFNALNQYQPLWLTFNSPAAYAIKGYYQGMQPPGKTSMQTAVEVLHNLLQAHVAAYHAMKAQPDGKKSEIGILHNILHLDIWHYWNPLDYLARYWGNKLSHTCVYDFFTTGIFSIYIPGKASYTVVHDPQHVCSSLDFIGLNYYSHNYMRFFKPTPASDEIPTANPRYTVYAEGLYRAIAELSERVTQPLEKKLKKEIPIYVTENGIGTDDNTIRETFFKRTLHALSQAHQKYNVKGYIYWSFMDNYEWGTYSKRYGVYHVDFANQQRTFKPGAQHFKNVLARWAQPLHSF